MVIRSSTKSLDNDYSIFWLRQIQRNNKSEFYIQITASTLKPLLYSCELYQFTYCVG